MVMAARLPVGMHARSDCVPHMLHPLYGFDVCTVMLQAVDINLLFIWVVSCDNLLCCGVQLKIAFGNDSSQ